MDKITEGTANEFIPDEFVVATPYRDLVLQRLTGTGARVTQQSSELDLSLIALTDVRHAAAEVRRQREEAHHEEPQYAGPGTPSDLERLMSDLRSIFTHRYDGWMPTMGKNRVMRGIQLFPYPDFMGGEDRPAPVTGRTRPDPITSDASAGSRARVMVLDTQIYAHPYLSGRFIADGNSMITEGKESPEWWAGHATFVAGLVVQRAPAVQLALEAVLTEEGRARSAWEVAVSMVRCTDQDVDILNLSIGCFTLDGDPPLVLERAIQRISPKVVVVAAAGNYGASKNEPDNPPTARTPIWPAAFEQVVAVGANKYGGNDRAPFSPDLPWVDLLAPGYQVQSTYLDGPVQLEPDAEPTEFGGMASWSGTSFAAAAVSGAIAARTEAGGRTAYEALADLRAGNGGESSTGIEVARFAEDRTGRH